MNAMNATKKKRRQALERQIRAECTNGVVASIKDGEPVYLHNEIMEDVLGRPLGDHEVVVHKNGDTFDNRRANLQLLELDEPTMAAAFEATVDAWAAPEAERSTGGKMTKYIALAEGSPEGFRSYIVQVKCATDDALEAGEFVIEKVTVHDDEGEHVFDADHDEFALAAVAMRQFMDRAEPAPSELEAA